MQFVCSALEMGELDRQTITEIGLPGRTLMETAGRAVALACRDICASPGQAVVACGTGNNGGDGFVTARALRALGYDVTAYIFGDRNKIRGDAKAALASLEKADELPLHVVEDARGLWQFASHLKNCSVAIDALLGTGVRGEVRGMISEAINVLNDVSVPVVAVDIASGVDSDTGAVLGRAVEAHTTVTFGFAKRGHYLYPGAELRGQLQIADIGIPARLAEELGVVGRRLSPPDLPALLPARRGDAHKGMYGHLAVVAGSPDMPGAAALTLAGALRGGAGLVSWAADEQTLAKVGSRPPEVMLRARMGPEPEAWADRVLQDVTAVTIGPGLSTEPGRGADLAAILGRTTVPVCLDADALNLLARDPKLWTQVRVPVVLTPHPKEMARLTNTDVETVQADRFAAALQLAVGRACVVVLKGAGTVIADPEGVVAVVDAGNPGLATGGTGDVLAGLIGALLAQGLDPTSAARAGALLHATAGDVAAATHGQTGLRASDVAEAVGPVLAQWQR